MRVTIIQDAIFWADRQLNLQQTQQHLEVLAGTTDLVVLPEMFTTGFCTAQLDLAEDMSGETVQEIRKWAKEYRIAITGSFLATEECRVYNRAFFVFPDGEMLTADKRHLFSFGGEDMHFSPGNKKLIVEYLGIKICVLVCYDIRFPVWARNVDLSYDLLIFVANFPKKRINDWDVLLKARAIENQAYVCGVNRVGVDGVGIEYNGHSVLLDYFGQPIVSCLDDETSIQTATISPDALHRYRSKFAVWKDADEFELK